MPEQTEKPEKKVREGKAVALSVRLAPVGTSDQPVSRTTRRSAWRKGSPIWTSASSNPLCWLASPAPRGRAKRCRRSWRGSWWCGWRWGWMSSNGWINSCNKSLRGFAARRQRSSEKQRLGGFAGSLVRHGGCRLCRRNGPRASPGLSPGRDLLGRQLRGCRSHGGSP